MEANIKTEEYYLGNIIEQIGEAEKKGFIVHTNSKENNIILVDYDSRDLDRFCTLLNFFIKFFCPVKSVKYWNSKSKGFHFVVELYNTVSPMQLLFYSSLLGGDEKHIILARNNYNYMPWSKRFILESQHYFVETFVFKEKDLESELDHVFIALFQPPFSEVKNLKFCDNLFII